MTKYLIQLNVIINTTLNMENQDYFLSTLEEDLYPLLAFGVQPYEGEDYTILTDDQLKSKRITIEHYQEMKIQEYEERRL